VISHLVHNPEIDLTLVGRLSPVSGIGQITEAFYGTLSDRVNLNFINTEGPLLLVNNVLGDRQYDAGQLKAYGNVSVFADVLWNGAGDAKFKRVPNSIVKVAYVAFDSSVFPPEWLAIIESDFDCVAVPTPSLKKVLLSSGVKKPVFVLPLALDLRPYLQTTKSDLSFQPRPFRFGTVSAYHRRKNHDKVIAAFLDAFGPKDTNFELVIHSNLNFFKEYERLQGLIERAGAKNIILSHGNLSSEDCVNFLNSLDVYVLASAGEGFSITPRQALALGKTCVLSGIFGHDDINSSGLCLKVESKLPRPAIYDEIDGRVFGLQYDPYHHDLVQQLLKAHRQRQILALSAKQRCDFATQYDLSIQRYAYKALCKPATISRGSSDEITEHGLVTQSTELYEKYAKFTVTAERKKLFSKKNDQITRKVLIGHDGGFFSLFNTYLSHLVWNADQGAIQHILPDWRIESMVKYWKTDKFTSFCYGRKEDGNIWLKLFGNPYKDLPEEAYQTDELLYQGATGPFHNWNSEKEPYLTYIHAYELYRRTDFQQWRQWYNYYYRQHVHMNPAITNKVNSVYDRNLTDTYSIGMHVRHPSHAIEQPGQKIAHFDKFIQLARQQLAKKQKEIGSNWKVFLATDQDRVVRYFREEFGEHLVTVADIARTTEEQDQQFDSLSKQEQMKEGFQIQHRMASDHNRWSTHLAEEVCVDALLLSKCNSFIHTTSNVATAVSFMNPAVEMIYCG